MSDSAGVVVCGGCSWRATTGWSVAVRNADDAGAPAIDDAADVDGDADDRKLLPDGVDLESGCEGESASDVAVAEDALTEIA